MDEYEASLVLDAINFGFSAKKALSLKSENLLFRILNIKKITRKKNLRDVRARVIGREGKTRKTIEGITNSEVLIKDNEIGIIGEAECIEHSIQAITSLIKGSKQANVYARLEREKKNRRLNPENYESIKMLYKAQDLKISNVRIFGTADKFYDFAANVQNQNEKWMAKVSYHFKYGNTETEMQTASVMPLSERPLVAFGLENDTFPTGVNFVLDKIDWEAVDPHRISNAEAFLAERNLFSIDNFYVDLPSATGLPVPALYMDLLNQSAYSYWEPVFLVELINGNQTVGYIHLYFDKIEAFSTEKVDLRYFNKTTEFNNVRIIPTMNYFDESIYIGPGEL